MPLPCNRLFIICVFKLTVRIVQLGTGIVRKLGWRTNKHVLLLISVEPGSFTARCFGDMHRGRHDQML